MNIHFSNAQNSAKLRYQKDTWKLIKLYRGIYLDASMKPEIWIITYFTHIAEYVFGKDIVLAGPTAFTYSHFQKNFFFRGNVSRVVQIEWFTFVCSKKHQNVDNEYSAFINNSVLKPSLELSVLELCNEYRKYPWMSKKEIGMLIVSKIDDINLDRIDTIVNHNRHLKSAKMKFLEINWKLKGTRSDGNGDLFLVLSRKGFKPQKNFVEKLTRMADFLKSQKITLSVNTNFNDEDIFNCYCFWESYYSNYIEWTKFLIKEAVDILEKGINERRPHDSHEVLTHVNFIKRLYGAIITKKLHIAFKKEDEFIAFLQYIHANMMDGVIGNAGVFKTEPNRVGAYVFVLPEHVEWTLRYSFHLMEWMNPEQKALFLHFLITEVHPFADGNGRTARIVMNSILIQNGLHPVIITSKHRDEYLGGVSNASLYENFIKYQEVMKVNQMHTASFSYAVPITENTIGSESEECLSLPSKWFLDSLFEI